MPSEFDLHRIVDNYDATHKHPKLRTWLVQRPRYHMPYTPTYSSWLNQVERLVWSHHPTRYSPGNLPQGA